MLTAEQVQQCLDQIEQNTGVKLADSTHDELLVAVTAISAQVATLRQQMETLLEPTGVAKI